MNCDSLGKLVKEKISSYFEETIVNEVDGEFCVIILPILKSDNDLIELYLEEDKNGIKISDGGIISELFFLSGVNIKSGKKLPYLYDRILKTFEVSEDNDELYTYTSKETIGMDIVQIQQAISQLSTLTNLVGPKDERRFHELVKHELHGYNKIFDENYKVTLPNNRIKRVDFNVHVDDKNIFLEALHATTLALAQKEASLTGSKFYFFKKYNIINGKNKAVIVYDDKDNDFWSPETLEFAEEFSSEVVAWSNKRHLFEEILAPTYTF